MSNSTINWKDLYHEFRHVWNMYVSIHPNKYIGLQVLHRGLNPIRRADYFHEVNSFQLDLDPNIGWKRLEVFRELWDKINSWEGYSPDNPADSVYQTAIQIMQRCFQDETYEDDHWLFRGQCDHRWIPIPSIFRGEAGYLVEKNQFQARLIKLRKVIHRLKQTQHAKDELIAMAIAQHYSNELDVKTWLLDFSTSPWVALFFASHGGHSGQIATVSYIKKSEWLTFSSDEENALGKLQYVHPEGIKRIENQSAFFVELLHPELYRQLVPYGYYFTQHEGEVFEDKTLSPPIAEKFIYPIDDMLKEEISNLNIDTTNSAPLQWEPSLDYLNFPSNGTFSKIAKAWTKNTPDIVIHWLCKIHTELTKQHNELPHYIVTLHHLRRIMKFVETFGVSVKLKKELLEFEYIPYLETSEHKQIFLQCIVNIDTELHTIAQRLVDK